MLINWKSGTIAILNGSIRRVELLRVAGDLKMKKVITYGTFDLFHEGHYRLLRRAKMLGDYLIVGVTTDSYDMARGKMNVADSLVERIEHVKQTGLADEIIVEDHVGQKVGDILKYDIDIFAIGSDWTGEFDYLKPYCEVVYLERTRDISSTILRNQTNGIVNMGIVATGRIASRFVPESKYVSGLNVESVYNPHGEHARDFRERFELNGWYDDFDKFLDSVDAVYIASPHETHYEYARMALERGKHVLCEKPMVFRENEAKELFELAENKGCTLMEAIKTAYCPGFMQLMGVARSGIIGDICDVEAAFTKLENPSARELTDKKYGGSFMELASYTLLPAIKFLGTNYDDIHFEKINNESGIDIYSKAYLRYPRGFSTAKCGLGVKSEGRLIISGTKGCIVVDAPWWKTKSFEIQYENPENNERYFAKFLGDGIRYELSEFVLHINGNQGKTFGLLPEESVALAGIFEKFRNYTRNNIERQYL